MGKKELVKRLAQTERVAAADAADQLDTAVHAVLKNLRERKRPRGNALQRLVECAKSLSGTTERSAKP